MTTRSTDGYARARKGGAHQPTPYSDGYVEAGGLRLHYLDYGTSGRPAMLCVHGGAAHGHWFDFVAQGFTANYHVRALDQRGHGDSEWADPPAYSFQHYAADLAQVVEKLDLHDFVLVGHSMGGTVCLEYASRFPGRMGKLVVIDSTLRMPEERLATMRQVGSRQGTSYDTHEAFLANYRMRPAGTLAAPEVVRHLARNGARLMDDGRWRHKFDRNIYATRERGNGMACWDRIHVPALLVKGDRSQRITPEISAEVKALCPHAEFVEVSNSEHHVTLDNPGECIDVIQEFLARHP